MTVAAAGANGSGPTTNNPNWTTLPSPIKTDMSYGPYIDRMKRTGADPFGPGPRQKAENDAKYWLEPAGYRKLNDETTFNLGAIEGVLPMTRDLVGVTTSTGERFWISNLTNPGAFAQAQMALERFNATNLKPQEVERRFVSGGYERWTGDWHPDDWDEDTQLGDHPARIKYAITQGEWAGFVFEDHEYKEHMYYMHKNDDPELWHYMELAPEIKRRGYEVKDFWELKLPDEIQEELANRTNQPNLKPD